MKKILKSLLEMNVAEQKQSKVDLITSSVGSCLPEGLLIETVQVIEFTVNEIKENMLQTITLGVVIWKF